MATDAVGVKSPLGIDLVKISISGISRVALPKMARTAFPQLRRAYIPARVMAPDAGRVRVGPAPRVRIWRGRLMFFVIEKDLSPFAFNVQPDLFVLVRIALPSR